MNTEEEAKELWCVHARMDQRSSVVSNMFNVTDTIGCIGSKCMAWRWAWGDEPYPDKDGFKNDASGKGYCGLAGKP